MDNLARLYPPGQSFRVDHATSVPSSVIVKILRMHEQRMVRLNRAVTRIQRWYRRNRKYCRFCHQFNCCHSQDAKSYWRHHPEHCPKPFHTESEYLRAVRGLNVVWLQQLIRDDTGLDTSFNIVERHPSLFKVALNCLENPPKPLQWNMLHFLCSSGFEQYKQPSRNMVTDNFIKILKFMGNDVEPAAKCQLNVELKKSDQPNENDPTRYLIERESLVLG